MCGYVLFPVPSSGDMVPRAERGSGEVDSDAGLGMAQET